VRIDRLKIFLDSMGGGAWPFLVGGVICLVNSVNERDLSLLTSSTYPLCCRLVLPTPSSGCVFGQPPWPSPLCWMFGWGLLASGTLWIWHWQCLCRSCVRMTWRWHVQIRLLRGTICAQQMEVWGNNRSVMPLDVLGRTRATLMHSASLQPWLKGLGNLLKVHRDWDRWLKLFIFNEEYLVNARHHRALITSLPFVHTARRSYRWMGWWKHWIGHFWRWSFTWLAF
jgi:hypothetical protein